MVDVRIIRVDMSEFRYVTFDVAAYSDSEIDIEDSCIPCDGIVRLLEHLKLPYTHWGKFPFPLTIPQTVSFSLMDDERGIVRMALCHHCSQVIAIETEAVPRVARNVDIMDSSSARELAELFIAVDRIVKARRRAYRLTREKRLRRLGLEEEDLGLAAEEDDAIVVNVV